MMSQLTQDYLKQIGVKSDWRVGDMAYRQGEMVTILKVVHDASPPFVVVRTWDGKELGTEFASLSELPNNSAFENRAAPGRINGDRAADGAPGRFPTLPGASRSSLPDLCLVSPSTEQLLPLPVHA